MKIAILNYGTVATFDECKDMPLWEAYDSDIVTFASPVTQEVCTEANLPEALTNLQYNVSEEVGEQLDRPDLELVWSDSETTEGVYEGRDETGTMHAVIVVKVVEV
jgi:hypothetical protein